MTGALKKGNALHKLLHHLPPTVPAINYKRPPPDELFLTVRPEECLFYAYTARASHLYDCAQGEGRDVKGDELQAMMGDAQLMTCLDDCLKELESSKEQTHSELQLLIFERVYYVIFNGEWDLETLQVKPAPLTLSEIWRH